VQPLSLKVDSKCLPVSTQGEYLQYAESVCNRNCPVLACFLSVFNIVAASEVLWPTTSMHIGSPWTSRQGGRTFCRGLNMWVYFPLPPLFCMFRPNHLLCPNPLVWHATLTTCTPQLPLHRLHPLLDTLHQLVTFVALYLLQCLKAHFPVAKGSSGHCLFISVFILSSKIICNNTYLDKSWCIVG